MSAWPQAVWIINKLSAKFDFSDQITLFTTYINELNTKVNSINSNLSNMEHSVIVSSTQPTNRFQGLVWIQTTS